MLKDYLCHIANTLTGMYQLPFSQEWDARLNELLDEGVLLFVGEYTATFSTGEHTVEVWITNRWYSFGGLYCFDGECAPQHLQARPRFRTMRRLYAAVKKHVVKESESCF
ncbi:hypothetical protein ACK1DB_001181 [Salmonella enterica]|nr:hypothetical protein [Salmonella enterica]EEF4185889.1 hypothetical protein [Salmonella enterica]EEM8195686.1 hypothetical protein [Salmonella enterica]EGB4213762.1 hypothetical protein [Salmonella enterica]EIL9385151.1 hypothetical protein [Salmonella enterica]